MVWASSYDKPEEHPIARIPGKCVPPFQLRSALSKTINEYLCNLNVGSRTSAVRLSGIICTLGIATREVNEIEELIESGMNVACLNFRHGSEDYYRKVIENIQTASKNYDQKIGMHCPISIALKLKGQIIRCFPFGAHTIEITLYENTTVNVSGDLDFVSKDRNPNTLYINYGNIHNVVQVGGGIVIGYKQNEVELVCVAIDGVVLSCRVAKGGDVRSGQCVQLPGAPVNFPLTFHDTKALLFAKEYGIDILFVPYIRSAATVNDIRDFLTSHDINMMVCSQIDNVAGLKNVEEIIKVSDGIVVNRGDLWNEIDQNKSFIPQKSIIAKCNLAGKPVVCTRHFLNSMIKNPRPTRAESCDLANAILDGVDCIMVYHQTAMGEYPSACVQTAAKICKQAEAAVWQRQLIHDLSENITPPIITIEALTTSVVRISLGILASAIIVISSSFKSAEMITQCRPKCPVIVVTRNAEKARRSHLFRGIIPLVYREKRDLQWLQDVKARIFYGINFGRKKGFIQPGDTVVIMKSSKQGAGFTDTMTILQVTQNVSHGKECTC